MNDEQTEASRAPYDLAQLDELYLQGEISPTQYWALQRKLLHDVTLSQRFTTPPPYLDPYPPPAEAEYHDPYPAASADQYPPVEEHPPPHALRYPDAPPPDPYRDSYQDPYPEPWYDPYPDHASYQEIPQQPPAEHHPQTYQDSYRDPWYDPYQDYPAHPDQPEPADPYQWESQENPWERHPGPDDSYTPHPPEHTPYRDDTTGYRSEHYPDTYLDYEQHGFLPPAPFSRPEESVPYSPRLLPGLDQEPLHSPPPIGESPATRAARRAARTGEIPSRTTRRERRTSAAESVYAPTKGAVDLFDTDVPEGGLRRRRRRKRPWWWWLWPFGRR
ncbi:hypothetical protein SAMN05421595_1752 [Austwickia chelonae]|uniref:SHOCT domain-containing protein n=1 Tax=Austwickia chelonae NBRC 105200 TaxID=1184607 RepID=K6VIR2_9MICO|nr:hypothetical protein [Austwickia chelonae]GAB76619.1 hypothetical protein AUCHE_01_01810 [Austwickia chelonae NBRC 105200]SEW28132.1 hypothetical protein SAMN05421595_1752 [Austwickia chelonae]